METTVASKKETFFKHLKPVAHPAAQQAVKNALSKIEELDFPDRKTEDWKYTRTAKITNAEWKQAETVPNFSDEKFFLSGSRQRVVIVDGLYVEAASSLRPEGGIKIYTDGSFPATFGKKSGESDNIFTHINTAYHTAAVFIHVAKKTTAKLPIDIIVAAQNDIIAQPRIFIHVEEAGSAEVNLFLYGADTVGSFTNLVVEAEIEKAAELTLNKVQYEGAAAKQISTEEINQHANSRFSINTVTLNGGLVRNGLNIYVDGEQCETHLYGLYLLKGKQHVDNHTKVDHLKANCQSNEVYKGVVDESATAVFNGKVYVRPDSQKINAFQNNRNIVLTDTAAVYTKPELEIYADDVKCSHGCTVGQLDEDAMFYLRARGMSERKAKELLIAAFATDVLNNIASEEVRNKINELLHERFGWEM